MKKYFYAFRKEWLLLIRDKAGLALLFVMPMALIIISSLMQEYGWSSVTKEPTVEVLFVDNDRDSLGIQIHEGLKKSENFIVIDSVNGAPVTEAAARASVTTGKKQIAIIIPKGATDKLRMNVRIMVAKTLAGFGMANLAFLENMPASDSVNIGIYFDPAIKKAFKNALIAAIKANNYRSETSMIFRTFNQELALQMPMFKPPKVGYHEVLQFKESFPSYRAEDKIPDSVQHNVPAWTIFAMFFIVMPMTQSLIKEREEGSIFRLLTLPVPYMTLLMAKVGVYLIVCILQTILMLLTGMFLIPFFDLPMLDLGKEYLALVVMTITVALAAVGFGLMIGTVAKTHQQAAAFGSISVIILAAMGGLWVPLYLMPPIMRKISEISPLNWAINGYYNIFLRGGSIRHILPEIIRLGIFFLATVSITAVYRRFKSPLNP
jgi:ABC-2 type transport system permease protein